jgi:putative heme-binding domain-containing protein
MRFALSASLSLTFAHALFAQQPALVAPTNALTPDEEQKKLIVPDGFEVQLVASEPDIQKPMQMAFDAKGRIWVTTSYHYPFPAPAGKATDKLFILSDFDAKGKARKVQTFAADLNIPIGILPLPDCKSCIVSTVGEILKLTDTDDDGKYDKREVLFGGFGSRDTHGMYNSYTLMPDGWVYACHGFNNDSKTKGTDGKELAMRSGNTFRFKPDGSKIEAFTRGQVNPFGMCIDPWFNFYTADCHSKPITNLIPGATYESFNSTSDALGFGPVMFGYDPGGTGLCGVCWYDADHFPAKYKGNLFLGNVVTNRVNMCKVEWTGGTPRAVQQTDFIKSNDPWFRPVDVKLGPDGAVYVNDFYNKIIGHYEVDLKHPGRDKDRGRIWRVVKTGPAPKPEFDDLTKLAPDELVKHLESPNLAVRRAAWEQFALRPQIWADSRVKPPLDKLGIKNLPRVLAPVVMLSASGGALPKDSDYLGFVLIMASEADNPDSVALAVAIGKSLGMQPNLSDKMRTMLVRMLSEPKAPVNDGKVRRAAAETMAIHPHADFVKPLVEAMGKLLPGDDHTRHAVKIALRNCLLNPDKKWDEAVTALLGDAGSSKLIAEVMLGVPNQAAADYLVAHLARHEGGATPAAAEHIGRYGNDNDWLKTLQATPGFTGETQGDAATTQGLLFVRQLLRGIQASGKKLTPQELAYLRVDGAAAIKKIKGKPANTSLVVESLAMIPGLIDRQARPELARFAADQVFALANNAELDGDSRGIVFDGLSRLDPLRAFKLLTAVLNEPAAQGALKERALISMANVPMREARGEVNVALKGVPYRVAAAVALNMASTKVGSEELLASVKAGFMPARVLQEKLVLERLRAANVPGLDKQIGDLTKGLPPADQKLAELIKQRTVKFTGAKLDKEAGAKLFTKHCAACHKIGNDGGKVGPNLDGVGLRGLERLLEDVLDPNRNVDAAFRARVLNLVDGTTKTGLMLRVEGEVLVMADDQGKEFRVPTKDIEKNRETALSPMPANFGEAIPEAEFYQLLGWLMDQKTKDVPKKE